MPDSSRNATDFSKRRSSVSIMDEFFTAMAEYDKWLEEKEAVEWEEISLWVFPSRPRKS